MFSVNFLIQLTITSQSKYYSGTHNLHHLETKTFAKHVIEVATSTKIIEQNFDLIPQYLFSY